MANMEFFVKRTSNIRFILGMSFTDNLHQQTSKRSFVYRQIYKGSSSYRKSPKVLQRAMKILKQSVLGKGVITLEGLQGLTSLEKRLKYLFSILVLFPTKGLQMFYLFKKTLERYSAYRKPFKSLLFVKDVSSFSLHSGHLEPFLRSRTINIVLRGYTFKGLLHKNCHLYRCSGDISLSIRKESSQKSFFVEQRVTLYAFSIEMVLTILFV